MASKRTVRRLFLSLAFLAFLAAAADLAITHLVMDEGLFRGRPLPPFGPINHPRQAWWVQRHLEGLEAGEISKAPGVFDKELGWSHQPLSQSGGGVCHINGSGMRGQREYEPQPPPETKRLLCVGDSFTFGSEVADAEAWPAQLEALDPTIEALNFGVASYGTDQALLRYRRVAPDFPHAVACLGVLVENIGRNVNRYRPLYYPSSGSPGVKPRFVLDGDELVLVPQPFATRREMVFAVADGSVVERTREHEYWSDASDMGIFAHSSIARLGAAWSAYSKRQSRRLWSDESGEPFRVTMRILEVFQTEALAGGADRAIILIFPRESELTGYLESGERYWQTMLDGLDSAGIEHLDVSEDLLEFLRKEGRAPRSLYVGGHLNEEGNRIVAEAVARCVGSPR